MSNPQNWPRILQRIETSTTTAADAAVVREWLANGIDSRVLPAESKRTLLADYDAMVTECDRLKLEKAELREVVRSVEWKLDHALGRRCCIWCEWRESDGHAPDCPRQAVLKEAEDAQV